MDLDNLPDGWTIYIWLIAGAMIIVAAIYGLRWAKRNDQFDEDIKYLVFDENDKNKMTPEEFKKSQQVLETQMNRREEFLKEKAEAEQLEKGS
ncbi:hypothetical protein Tel_00460 [Candidatus Tenderia electrophaga]|jgi:nitrogen fixation-related uncharacterized protein|uniref:Uncharacterized protein n=1 Tax=Candidatus Tenderia electrophaga TaxID=1748243 RepID=A0A0S2T9C7_9GAMM|nr:hypothetical protein Tel_00460 [Candidatus Tenderia electrophaga]